MIDDSISQPKAKRGRKPTSKREEDEDALVAAMVRDKHANAITYIEDDEGLPPPDHGMKGKAIEWTPPLTTRGLKLWKTQKKKYILLYGERGSSKSVGALHFMLKHAYENDGARVCIATKERSGATEGGPWSKLMEIVLPQWQEGYTRWDGQKYPGFGLEGEGKDGEIMPKTDLSKNLYFFIKNRHGGWSKIFTRSFQHADQIQSKIRTVEFTAFMFDELTLVDSDTYFIKIVQQLFRRPGNYDRFFLGTCNPPEEGEDHWVHKLFLQDMDAPKSKNNPNPKSSQDYLVMHFPMWDNWFIEPTLKKDLIASVAEEGRNDPTAIARLIHGEWVKKPTGKGIFKDYWNRDIHVAGTWDPKKPEAAQLILPDPGRRTIDIGYDPGEANYSITFLQPRRAKHGEGWMVFDEIVLTGKHVPAQNVAVMLLDHMDYWVRRMQHNFWFHHIADAAAFNQMNYDGSFDAMKMQQYVREALLENPEKWPGLQYLVQRGPGYEEVSYRIAECPKPHGSKSGRVRMVVELLQHRLIKVSAKCVKTIEMFESLDRSSGGVFEPEGGPQKHPFDSMSYPIYHHEMGGRLYGPRPAAGAGTELYALPG